MRKNRGLALPFLALTLVLAALAGLQTAVAQDNTMYKWTDENGVVHFSDRAPPGQDVQAQQLPESPKPGSVSPIAAGETEAAEADASAAQQRREEIAARSAEGRAQQQQVQSQCLQWRAELERIEPNRRVFYTDEQGETVRMDDVERANRVAELRRLISESCG